MFSAHYDHIGIVRPVDGPALELDRDVLDTRLAYLVPLGTLAPLAGPPIRYPPAAEGQEPVLPSLDLRPLNNLFQSTIRAAY